MSKRSLKTVFLLAFIGFSVLQSLLLGAIAASRLATELEEQFKDRALSLTERVAQETFYAAFLQGGKGLTPLVKGLVDQNILYVQIVVKGQVKAEVNPQEIALPAQKVPAGAHLEKLQLSQGPSYLDLTRALTGRPQDEAQDSYVRIGMSLEYVQYEVRRQFTVISATALAVVLLGVGVAFGLYRLLLGPLERLTRSVRRFARDLDTRAPRSRWLELDSLAQEFNAMAEAIASMKGQLERDSRAKSEFLTIVGHELRTPLHSILGYAELLEEQIGGPLSGSQWHQVRSLRQSGEHLLELVESILRYAKLEMGQESLHRTALAVDELVQEVLGVVRPLAGAKGLSLQAAVEVQTAVADRTKLKQILLNLLQNAVRHSQRGRICLEAAARDSGVAFRVRDQGPGIASQDQQRIFEPFTQLEKTPTRSVQGLGLGLTIVKRYTELHQGRLSIHSEPGEGSCFEVWLPPPASRRCSMRILIAEDDESARDVLESYLCAKGHEVRCAADGQAALRLFLEDEPDVVLLDIMMPKMDGWEVLEAIRAHSQVPVLMVTAQDDTDDVVRGLSAGVDDYIVKPFKLREVEARIQAVLRRTASLTAEEVTHLGALQIDDARKRVTLHDRPVELSPKEYALLRLLASKPGQVFSDEQIIRCVWPEGSLASSTDVKRYVHLLRQKVEPDPKRPQWVLTVRGFGYKLEGKEG